MVAKDGRQCYLHQRPVSVFGFNGLMKSLRSCEIKVSAQGLKIVVAKLNLETKPPVAWSRLPLYSLCLPRNK